MKKSCYLRIWKILFLILFFCSSLVPISLSKVLTQVRIFLNTSYSCSYFPPVCSSLTFAIPQVCHDKVSGEDGRNKFWQNLQPAPRLFTLQGLFSLNHTVTCRTYSDILKTVLHLGRYVNIYSAGLLPQCGTGASPPVQVLRGSQEVWKDWH